MKTCANPSTMSWSYVGIGWPARRFGVPSGLSSHEPDREQLHQLARVVLVGTDVARGVGLLVAEHRQVHAHRRMQRHVLHQLAEVAEGVARACRSSSASAHG